MSAGRVARLPNSWGVYALLDAAGRCRGWVRPDPTAEADEAWVAFDAAGGRGRGPTAQAAAQELVQ